MIKSLSTSTFLHDVLKILLGTGFARVVTLAFYPILGRLYNPDDFGLYSVFMSWASIGVLCVTLRYELLLYSIKKTKVLWSLLAALLVNGTFVAALAAIVIAILVSTAKADTLFFALPIAVFCGACYILGEHFFIRKRVFKAYGMLAALSGTAVPILQTGFFVVFGTAGLILGNVAAQVLSTIFIAWLLRRFWGIARRSMRRSTAVHTMKTNLDFPLKVLPQKYLSEFHNMFFILVLSWMFAVEQVGVVAMAMKMLAIPSSLVVASTTNVSTQRISYLQSPREQFKFLKRKQVQILSIAIGPAILLYALAEEFLVMFLGASWLAVAPILQQMIPLYLLIAFFHPFLNMFYVNKWSNSLLLLEVIKVVIVSGVLAVSYYSSAHLEDLLCSYIVATFIGYLVIFAFLWRKVYRLAGA